MGDALRGGCDGLPLTLTGGWTGYNNGPTMQVGLWIRNDGEYIDWARRHALEGPVYLRQVLSSLMEDAPAGTAPDLAWQAASESGGLIDVDWAQICYDLVFAEPDDEDLREARFALMARMGFQDSPGESEIWELAYTLNREAAERVAMRGIR